MARTRTIYRCTECGAVEPKWAGRCAACEAWNSLVEEVERPVAAGRDEPLGGGAATPLPIADVDMDAWAPSATGIGELDRVLQGGLVPGSVTLLGGEPGIGKSTLLLQALAGLANAGRRCLYVTAEESAQQVRLRAERLGALPPDLWLVADTAMPHVLAHVEAVRPDVVAIDSIQTVYEPDAVVGARVGGPGARVRPPPRAASRRTAAWPPCSSATSPRTAAWPAPGCSSTSSTPCSPSRASATTPCACCGP